VSFFELLAPQPRTEPRMPVWSRGPEGMVPGAVPVARTDTDAVLVTGLRAYPTRLEFALTARPHPDQLQGERDPPDR